MTNNFDTQIVPEIWVDGQYLVMRRNATLPARCIKTNRPATVLVEQTATRLHVRLLGMALFGCLACSMVPVEEAAVKFGCLFVAIVMTGGCMALFPRVRLRLPVCPGVVARRRLLLLVGWSVFALAMAVYAFATLFPPEQIQYRQYCMLTVFVLMGGAGAALYFSPFVGVEATQGEFTWLTGIGKAFLASMRDNPPGGVQQ
jgi:hypothetical protein